MTHLNTSNTTIFGVNYLNPPYPEVAHVSIYRVSGVRVLIPSGQGHFSEQKVGNVSDSRSNRPLQNTTELDSTLNNNDPYGVGSYNAVGLIEAPDLIDYYNFSVFVDTVNQYNDLGGYEDRIQNAPISFLRPAYSQKLKTSIFPIGRASGIVNLEAHPLAIDAAASGGGFNYLSNAYYYITKKSLTSFIEHQVIDRGDYTSQNIDLTQPTLSNNIKGISQVSGTITNILDY